MSAASGGTCPALPPELADRIIDCLRGDPWALCAAALTCRLWLPRSRFNLFHTMVVRRSGALDCLVRLSRATPSLIPPGAVHELQLYERGKSAPLKVVGPGLVLPDEPWVPVPRKSFAHLIALMLPRLVAGVRVLRIEALEWVRLPVEPNAVAMYAAFGAVRVLALEHCEFGSFGELQRVLCALRVLEELTLHDVRWANSGAPRAIRSRREPQLAALCLHRCREKEGNALLEWVLLTPSARALRELRLLDPALDVAIVEQAAAVLGPTLETVRLDLSSFTPDLVNLPAFELLFVQCTRLVSLHITSYRNDMLDGLAGQLSKVASRCLRHIELDVVTTVDSEQKLQDQLLLWEEVDGALAQKQFVALESVVVEWRLRRFKLEEEVMRGLPGLFGKLRARDILRLTVRTSRLTVIYEG